MIGMANGLLENRKLTMNYELKTDDAIVSCQDHDSGKADFRDRQAARKFPPTCAEVPGEVDAFCAALMAVPSLDYEIARSLCPILPLPRGFNHFRLFTPGEETPFHRTMKVGEISTELTARSVIYAVLCSPCTEVTAWSTTSPRPTSLPGVLDLDVDIVSREAFRPLRLRE